MEAGRPYKLAKAKLRSRLRATARRWAHQPARAARDIALNKLWAEEHDHSLEGATLEGGDAFEDVHKHRFEGDEGLEPNLEHKPYDRKEWRKHVAEKEQPVLRSSEVKARRWDKPKHMKPHSTEAKTNANRKRAARRKAHNLVQATAAPKWHAAKRETLSWEEQASDKAKRPRTTGKFPTAPWASTASSSGMGDPRPPVFGPPAGPAPGRERTRSPEEPAKYEDEQSAQFSMVGCRRLIGWDTERQRLARELENVETKEEADELDRKISALTAQLDEDDARYAPGAEQARTRKRLEKIARETIEVGGDEEGVAPLAQAPIPALRPTSINTGTAEGERKSEVLLCVPSRPGVQGWRPVSLPAQHQGVAGCAEPRGLLHSQGRACDDLGPATTARVDKDRRHDRLRVGVHLRAVRHGTRGREDRALPRRSAGLHVCQRSRCGSRRQDYAHVQVPERNDCASGDEGIEGPQEAALLRVPYG